MKRLLIFGYGFTGAALARRLDGGWSISATSRDAGARARMAAQGLDPLDPADPVRLAAVLGTADALLVAAPPGEQGCPALQALEPRLAAHPVPLIGYLSTTGVYGDCGGAWVRETTPAAPASPEGQRRLQAEQGWRAAADAIAAALFVFRLPGIYGPGRSALDRVRAGEARRWIKPGQVFSRIHVDDLADALARALSRPQRAGCYNLCDDEPCAAADVTGFAASLLQRPIPREAPLDTAALSPMARRFWAESKRVSNARAKAAFDWRPLYRTYREGLTAVLAAERSSMGDGDPHLAG